MFSFTNENLTLEENIFSSLWGLTVASMSFILSIPVVSLMSVKLHITPKKHHFYEASEGF